ncbi:hypothetical protein SAV14893_086770 [Streptomyces avermitilis]|uniref:Uncharacterized protein n=1 Tax=Streptomyces avermitilis TaxID=33903 RepID=A0A4D4MBS5_STRAX|nr:hypothetical protein SAV14893_086770 [Streptomyces avermitilis]
MGASVRLPPALSEKRPGTPPAMDAVLAKALAKVPEDRYGSCLEFVAALRVAASGAVQGSHPQTQVDAEVLAAGQHSGPPRSRLCGPGRSLAVRAGEVPSGRVRPPCPDGGMWLLPLPARLLLPAQWGHERR